MSEISRRRFLAGAAAGAAASAASFAHAAAAPADLGVCKLPAKWDESYELVVIGSGGAGLATAVSASQNGVKKILVLEKMSYIGASRTSRTARKTTPRTRSKAVTDAPIPNSSTK